MRVCMLAYAFYESDTRIMQYATALAQRGDLVDVIALRREGKAGFEVIQGVNVYRIQRRTVNEKGLFAYATRISRFLLHSAVVMRRHHKKNPYQLIHVHNVPDFLVFAALYPKRKNVPVILDIHDLLPEFYASKFGISHEAFLFKVLVRVERWSAAFANHVIIANHVWHDRLISRSTVAGKCSVVRNHPDLDLFIPQEKGKKQSDKFLMTYPGSLNWHQGLDVAIRAFARVADRMQEAEFHIYGEGPAKPSLIDLAKELGLEQRVVFHDFLPSREVAMVMAGTDLAVEPKRAGSKFGNEAASTKILEFMALGVPIVASHTRIHAHYYDDAIIRYYENDDAVQLAEAMLHMRNNPELRHQIAVRAQQYAAENNWQARKAEYLSLVDGMVSGHPNCAISTPREGAFHREGVNRNNPG
jgi:glycosyltransferase involved in cell wall biosynthesis